MAANKKIKVKLLNSSFRDCTQNPPKVYKKGEIMEVTEEKLKQLKGTVEEVTVVKATPTKPKAKSDNG